MLKWNICKILFFFANIFIKLFFLILITVITKTLKIQNLIPLIENGQFLSLFNFPERNLNPIYPYLNSFSCQWRTTRNWAHRSGSNRSEECRGRSRSCGRWSSSGAFLGIGGGTFLSGLGQLRWTGISAGRRIGSCRP